MRFQRIVQSICLFIFILSLLTATWDTFVPFPPDAFLRLDPFVLTGTAIAARDILALGGIGFILLTLTFLLGRFFCGYMCPLGITVDFFDWLFRRQRKNRPLPLPSGLYRIKYFFLITTLSASIFGVSFVFLFSPISLASRFYGTVLIPVARWISSGTFNFIKPFLDEFGFSSLSYKIIMAPRFSLVWTTTLILAGVFAGAFFSPRFWCRYLCPSGAIFSIFSNTPFLRRINSEECTSCGLCQKKCPMNAIKDIHAEIDHSECIVCGTCESVCPVGSIHCLSSIDFKPVSFSRSKRDLITAGIVGTSTALLTLTNAKSLYANPKDDPSRANIIRPPGAGLENEFLARCIRCGVCMAACPTNTLQPIGFDAGFSGFFSPRVVPRIGPCEPECRNCGMACPTKALRPLNGPEKISAKIGTARIIRHRCLAWEQHKKCLICDEACPFNAIEFKMVSGYAFAMPFVTEEKCWGCGYCETKCPIRPDRAVIVEPAGAIRLSKGSFVKAAREKGLDLSLGRKIKTPDPNPMKPGQNNSYKYELPPGFTE